MIECLGVIHELTYPGDAERFAATLATDVASALSKKVLQMEGLGKKGKVDKLLANPNFGSALRLVVLQNELRKLADKISDPALLQKLETYLSDVITPRNDFAHRRAKAEGELLYLQGRKQPFNQESMVALRLQLLAHQENLKSLLALLRKMVKEAKNLKLAGWGNAPEAKGEGAAGPSQDHSQADGEEGEGDEAGET
jgi:hypothetical protein